MNIHPKDDERYWLWFFISVQLVREKWPV